MTEIPAGWYDDPEHPDRYRYWDGARWTEHRAQKAPSALGSGATASAWQVVPDAFSLLARCWRELVILVFPTLLLSMVGFVLVYLAFDAALDPGLGEIIERLTDPDFDPNRNLADDRFIDSIDLSLGTTVVVGWVGGAVALLFGLLAAPLLMFVHLASVRSGRPLAVGATLRATVRKLPRIIGILLLWSLACVAAVAVVSTVFALLVAVSPLTLVLLVPVMLATVIFIWPYANLAFVTLVVAPRDRPPFRATLALVRNRWKPIALRILVLNLVLSAISLAVNAISAPLSVASVWAGLLGGLLIQSVQNALATSGTLVIYDWAGGALDPDLQGTPTEGLAVT